MRLSAAALGAFLLAAPALHAQPVTLINVFEVPPGQLEASLRYWEASRDFLRGQPGFVSTRLHQSLSPEARFQLINVAVWESAAAFQAASQRMQQEVSARPPEGLRFTPGLYRVVRE
jgi:heme-degrading monooxygenase HmoA